MAQVINTNIGSQFAAAALNKSNRGQLTAMQRLSSGLRINTAQDDPTGMVTATALDLQVRGTNMALRGVNDGISKAQTQDGYLAQINENLQRLNEIAVQAGGTAASVEATAINTENTRLAALVTGTGNIVNASNGGQYTGTGTTFTTVISGLTVGAIATSVSAVSTARAQYGADMASLTSAASNLQTASVNLSSQYSRVMDTDYAMETGQLTRNQILQQAGTAMLAQANQTPNGVLSLLR